MTLEGLLIGGGFGTFGLCIFVVAFSGASNPKAEEFSKAIAFHDPRVHTIVGKPTKIFHGGGAGWRVSGAEQSVQYEWLVEGDRATARILVVLRAARGSGVFQMARLYHLGRFDRELVDDLTDTPGPVHEIRVLEPRYRSLIPDGRADRIFRRVCVLLMLSGLATAIYGLSRTMP